MRAKRNGYRLLVGGNIKMDLAEIGCGSVDWICLVQNRDQWKFLVNTVMKIWVPFLGSS
jgi:hypothetical protein